MNLSMLKKLLITMMLFSSLWVSYINDVKSSFRLLIYSLDLTTLDLNVESDKYPTMRAFIRDVQKIFDNCRVYNAETTNYSRCANRLERYFKERLRVWTNGNEN
jgi:histone acetyltransferase